MSGEMIPSTSSTVMPPDDRVQRWNGLFRRGAMSELIDDLTQFTEQTPDCVDASIRLALAHWHCGHRSEAMDWAKRAAEISPDHPDVTYCHALFLGELGSDQEALTYLARTVTLDPDHWNGHVLMGMLYSRLGHGAKAVEAFHRARSLDGDDAGLLFQLGMVHASAGHRVSARETLQSAAELECEAFNRVPLQEPADNPLERILGRLQEDDEALEVLADLPDGDQAEPLPLRLEAAFRQAAASHPRYPDVQYRCGRLLARLGRKREALEHLERAVHLNSGYVKARLALADCYEDMEQPGRAAAHLEHALDQGGEHPDVHLRLGRCYRRLGRNREAADEFQRAADLNPGFTAAREALCELSEHMASGQDRSD